MGKSNKKIKNDRINTIRKQYDAFIEEDKKRRDRNEYILCKLDKMRSSTALVPVSTKVNYRMQLNPSEIFMHPNNTGTKADMRSNYASQLDRQNLNTGILNNPLDELRVLKEISRKYILIPKRTPNGNDYTYGNNVLDGDWRSKYDILDHLKKEEKGDSDPVISQYNDDNNNKKFDLSTNSKNSDKQQTTLATENNNLEKAAPDNYNEPLTVQNNSPVKPGKIDFNVPEIISDTINKSNTPLQTACITPNENVNLDQTQSDNSTLSEYTTSEQENITEKEKYNSESNEKDFDTNKTSTNHSQKCETGNINNASVYQDNVSPSDHNKPTVEANTYKDSENINPDTSNAVISNQTISDLKLQETGSAEYSEETVHHDNIIDSQKDARERMDLYESITTDNNPTDEVEANETTFEKTNHYDPAQNTSPVDLDDVQHQEHNDHKSDINEFEAEQKEMFYSEQTHADTYSYNQDEGNTGQYTDGYEQSEQYAYYEGVEQGQAYATNINEHEESTERYDPHYNQQYEGAYENEQPDNTVGYENNEYEQQQFHDENQRFENITNYEDQQENAHLYQENVSNQNEIQENVVPAEGDETYDQHLYSEQQNIQEHIEQQLATEEGYVENSHVIADAFQKEPEDGIETVMDATAAEEPSLDPKLS